MQQKTKTVRLSEPIVVGGKTLQELTMRRATLGDEEDALQLAVGMKRAQNALTVDMALISLLCRIPYDVMRGMTDADYFALKAAYAELNGKTEDQDPTTPAGTPASGSES